MAAWLAYLKSRLLLPPDPDAEGPSTDEMAAHLAFQLERLNAMREAAARLMGRPRLGQDRFARGAPETVQKIITEFVRAARWSSEPGNFDQAVAIWARSGTPEGVFRYDFADTDVRYRNSPIVDPFLGCGSRRPSGPPAPTPPPR